MIVSTAFLIPVALAYGLYPNIILWKLFDIKVETINLTNIFRATMSLYLGMSTIWIIGILKPEFWRWATLINIVFMGSLALGRLLSMIVDGVPSVYFILGFILESALALWGMMNLKHIR